MHEAEQALAPTLQAIVQAYMQQLWCVLMNRACAWRLAYSGFIRPPLLPTPGTGVHPKRGMQALDRPTRASYLEIA